MQRSLGTPDIRANGYSAEAQWIYNLLNIAHRRQHGRIIKKVYERNDCGKYNKLVSVRSSLYMHGVIRIYRL